MHIYDICFNNSLSRFSTSLWQSSVHHLDSQSRPAWILAQVVAYGLPPPELHGMGPLYSRGNLKASQTIYCVVCMSS
jgi:hypothetical protein